MEADGNWIYDLCWNLMEADGSWIYDVCWNLMEADGTWWNPTENSSK